MSSTPPRPVTLPNAGPAVAAGVHAPVTLLPTPFPRGAFEHAVRLAPAFNLLVDRVSRDPAYLRAALHSVLPYGAAIMEGGRGGGGGVPQIPSALSSPFLIPPSLLP